MKNNNPIGYFLIFTCLLNCANLFGQFDNVNYRNNISFRYFVGTSQPDTNWNKPDFNDSTWLTGHTSIGYGDGDDTIVTDTTVSIYLRKNLMVNENTLKKTKALIIYADFDDGFIAYLNGKEILRVNMDENMEHPEYMQTTSRSHEAENYKFLDTPFWLYQTVQGYYIDSAILHKCNFGNSNVLSFEVHNDSIKGSDLSFCFDYRYINDSSAYIIRTDYSRYYSTIAIDSTHLPIIVIETDEFGCDTSKVKARMVIIDNKNGKYNKPNDIFNGYNGFINLKIRGNSTSWYAKRAYSIETIDSAQNNNNVALLGMPKENDWALLASFADRTFLGNYLSFELGREMGHYEPRMRYCELIVNGRNQGLYMLTEKIKRDPNRVDIAKLKPSDVDSVDITGGYIFLIDMLTAWDIEYPNSNNITEAQKKYIFDYYSNAKKVLNSKNFLHPTDGYKKYFDVNTLADFMIVEELSGNNDAYSASFYGFKDRDDIDGRIKFGPLWDYDNAYGSGIWRNTITNGWRFESNSKIILRLLQDTSFSKLFASKWHAYSKSFLKPDSINAMIDNTISDIRSSIDMNFKIWPILGYDIYPSDYKLTPGNTYDDEIERLKKWITARYNWIDNNIDNIYYKITDIETTKNQNITDNIVVYPNPFIKELNIILNVDKTGYYEIAVTDISGRVITTISQKISYTGKCKLKINVPDNTLPGFYMLNVFRNNTLFVNQKLIKVN